MSGSCSCLRRTCAGLRVACGRAGASPPGHVRSSVGCVAGHRQMRTRLLQTPFGHTSPDRRTVRAVDDTCMSIQRRGFRLVVSGGGPGALLSLRAGTPSCGDTLPPSAPSAPTVLQRRRVGIRERVRPTGLERRRAAGPAQLARVVHAPGIAGHGTRVGMKDRTIATDAPPFPRRLLSE